MRTRSATAHPIAASVIGWVFGVLFLVIGVLNVFLVHPVPGLFYLLLCLVYLPPAYAALDRNGRLSIPLSVRVIVGLTVLWGSLAVGDLVDRYD
jgi:hypothetical protein